ncbi:MAG: hypothetical protein ACREBV_09100, partial [Candidatus Zixiibacteriota bacterium]
TIAIIIVGILIAVAMQSMTSVVDDARRTKTEREMEMLTASIVGDANITDGGGRADFGYVGDIGAFPPNIDAIYNNPGGYSTWDGPYLPAGYTQDSTGLKIDEWGTAYNYSGDVTINSTGSGSTITKKVARATNDYLRNTVHAVITDGADSLPGTNFKDSIDIKITIPNGTGSTLTKLYHPNQFGNFTLDSIPVGHHPLRIIFTPSVDTIFRYLTVFPRHKSSHTYKFSPSYFTTGGGNCSGSGTIVLRPSGAGSLTNLTTDGCANNWECVDETIADEDAARLVRASNSFATDVYNYPTPPASSCEILAVSVFCRARLSQTQGEVRPLVYINGTQFQGTPQAISSSYANYFHQWTTNPNTGANWIWTDINSLQAGTALKGQNVNFPAYCTQVWIEVVYSN